MIITLHVDFSPEDEKFLEGKDKDLVALHVYSGLIRSFRDKKYTVEHNKHGNSDGKDRA